MFSFFFFYYNEKKERRRRWKCHTHGDTYFYESKKSVGGEIRCFLSSRLKTLVEIYVRMPLIF